MLQSTALRWRAWPLVLTSAGTPMPTLPVNSSMRSCCVERAPAGVLPDFVDPYLDPSSGLLRNRLGLTNRADLDRAEAELVEARMTDPRLQRIAPTGDLSQLQTIHRALFQDVYDWAGELRTVDIRKGGDARAEFFMPSSRILSGAVFAFAELAADKQLQGLSRERFIERISYHYDQINYLHPFREGNGRTQRIFWNQLAARAGHPLDWRRTTGAINDEASRTAMERQDLSKLRTMFGTITAEPTEPTPPLSPEMQRVRDLLAVTFPHPAGTRPPATSAGIEASPYRPPARDLGQERER